MIIHTHFVSTDASFIPTKFEEALTTDTGSTRGQAGNWVMGTHRQMVSPMVKLTPLKNVPRLILYMCKNLKTQGTSPPSFK